MDVNSGYTGTAGALPGDISYATIDDGHTWLVTFSGANVTGNSIADGVYDITLNAADVTANSGGGNLASSRTDTFFRLFGDSNGDAAVNSSTRHPGICLLIRHGSQFERLSGLLRLRRSRINLKPSRCAEFRGPIRHFLERLYGDDLRAIHLIVEVGKVLQ